MAFIPIKGFALGSHHVLDKAENFPTSADETEEESGRIPCFLLESPILKSSAGVRLEPKRQEPLVRSTLAGHRRRALICR